MNTHIKDVRNLRAFITGRLPWNVAHELRYMRRLEPDRVFWAQPARSSAN